MVTHTVDQAARGVLADLGISFVFFLLVYGSRVSAFLFENRGDWKEGFRYGISPVLKRAPFFFLLFAIGAKSNLWTLMQGVPAWGVLVAVMALGGMVLGSLAFILAWMENKYIDFAMAFDEDAIKEKRYAAIMEVLHVGGLWWTACLAVSLIWLIEIVQRA